MFQRDAGFQRIAHGLSHARSDPSARHSHSSSFPTHSLLFTADVSCIPVSESKHNDDNGNCSNSRRHSGWCRWYCLAIRLLVSLVRSPRDYLDLAPKSFGLRTDSFRNHRRAVATLEKPKYIILEVLGQKKR